MMSPQRLTPLRALLLALMVVPPITLFASLSWLKQQPDGVVFLLSGIAAALTVIASLLFGVLHDRRLDEWERANARFSSQWGWPIGTGLVALLLNVPAFRDWMVSAIANAANVPNPDQKLVILAVAFGFGAVVLTQGVCTMLVAIGWASWKSRAPRELP